MPIDLFCSLIFILSTTDIQTTCTFSRLILTNVIIPASPYIEWDVSLARIERENVHVVCSTVSL